MRQRIESITKKVFEKPATRLAHGLVIQTPVVFNAVWGHAEYFAEGTYRTRSTAEKQIYLRHYFKLAPTVMQRTITQTFDGLPAVGWMMRQFLQFADWHAIAEDIFTSAAGYVEHVASMKEYKSE